MLESAVTILLRVVAVSIFFASNSYLGACQRQLVDVGPSDITRFEGERNVYIPCPFPGSLNPIWRIDQVDYEAFSLPRNMLPVSFGLLITIVELGMDGKSFQCILPTQQQNVFWISDVGKLTVELPPKSAQDILVLKPNEALMTTNTLKLDHKRIYFEASEKLFSWRNASKCTKYKVTSVKCGYRSDPHDGYVDVPVRTWDRSVIQGTSLTIDSEDTVYNDNTVYFRLQSVSADSGEECYRFPIYFSVNETTITEHVPTSYQSVCRDIHLSTGLYIALPNKTGGDDCLCSILFTNGAYNLTNCSCGSDTIFTNSFYITELTTQGNDQNNYKMCFRDLKPQMNNTIVHLYKSLRQCYDEHHSAVTRPIRMYMKSWKLVIELPNQPNVTADAVSGEVSFPSLVPGGIEVDHYLITLSDVTNHTLIHHTLPGDRTSISLGSRFHDNTCSPYNLTVRAYGISHNFISSTLIVKAPTPGGSDPCACIKKHADVELRLIEDDKLERSIQVNCTLTYEDDVHVKIVAEKNGKLINGSQAVICKTEKQFLTMDSLKCDQSYDLKAYYWSNGYQEQTYSSNNECLLISTSQGSVPCSRKGDTKIIIGTSSGLGSSILVIIIITILLVITVTMLCKRRNIQHTTIINDD